jgi:hypothetical protein
MAASPAINGLNLPNGDGEALDRREYRVTFPQGLTLGLKGERGSFDEDEVDHPVDQLAPRERDAYLKAIASWQTRLYVAVHPSAAQIARDPDAMGTVHILNFQRQMSSADERHLNPRMSWPRALVDPFNRIACALRTAMHDAHAFLNSQWPKEAWMYITSARYLIGVQVGVMIEAAQAMENGKMNNDWRSPKLNRVLMCHLYGFGQGLAGRKMFAVLVGLGNYTVVDAALSDSGKHVFFVTLSENKSMIRLGAPR